MRYKPVALGPQKGQRMCGRKVRYASLPDAREAPFGRQNKIYRCPVCDGWHHATRRKGQPRTNLLRDRRAANGA